MLGIEQEQAIVVQYITTLPIDSNRYLIATRLVKDLEAKKSMVDVAKKLGKTPRRVLHLGREFKSIGRAAYFMGLTSSQLYDDLMNDHMKYDAVLI